MDGLIEHDTNDARPPGFSLLELVISISIFMILTMITVWDFRTSGQANNLRQNAVELSANIRRAQTLSQSGGTVSVCFESQTTKCTASYAGCDCQKITPAGGFGISAVNGATDYSLFADMDNDGAMTAADVTVDEGATKLTDQVSFCGLRIGVIEVNNNTVTFEPPRGNVKQSGTHTFFLKHNAFSNTFRKITLNSLSGLIEEGSSTTCS